MKQFIILSFPRSGNTLFRTVIESVFNIKTIGYNSEIDMSPLLYQHNGHRDYNNEIIGIKRHSPHFIDENVNHVFFIVRDIDECINSHYDKTVKKHPEIDKQDFVKKMLVEYRENFMFAIGKHTCIIRYEDLVCGNLNINGLSDFIGVKPVNEFDFEEIKTISRELYKKELEETI